MRYTIFGFKRNFIHIIYRPYNDKFWNTWGFMALHPHNSFFKFSSKLTNKHGLLSQAFFSSCENYILLNQQYSFFLALPVANANAHWSHAQPQPQEPQLDFQGEMAIVMIESTLDDNGNTVPVLEGPRKRSWFTESSVTTK